MEVTPADGSASYCLGCEPVWHFDDQGSKNIMTEGRTLRTGDHVQLTCIFDSTGRSEVDNDDDADAIFVPWLNLKDWPVDSYNSSSI